MINMKKNVLTIFLIGLNLVGFGQLRVFSQVPPDIVISGSFRNTTEFKWSSDSTSLSFYNFDLGVDRDIQVNTINEAWQTVDVASEVLSEGMNTWPLQPILSEFEQATLMPTGFVYQSPDANLLIFAPESDSSDPLTLSIANRATGQVASLNLVALISPFRPGEFEVQWSSDSHAAVIAYRLDLGSGTLKVFHLDIPDFSDLESVIVREFNTSINGIPYTTTAAIEDELLDLSTDGQYVLLIGRDSSTTATTSFYDHPPELIIWNPYTDDENVVATTLDIEIDFEGSFESGNNNRVLLTNAEGLFSHRLDTNQTELLRDDLDTINSIEVFSPDGEWLAVAGSNALRLVSISALIPPSETSQISSISVVNADTDTDIYELSQVPPDMVVSGGFFATSDHKWSSDSSQFTYYNAELASDASETEVNIDSAVWQSIDVATGTVSEGMYTWPLQPTLTEAEQSAMNPASFIYQSPDGNLLFFPQDDTISGPVGDIYPLAIANRSTGQVVTFVINLYNYSYSPDVLRVIWSDDSHALVFSYRDFSNVRLIWHVDIPDFNDLQNFTLQSFDTTINSIPYSTTVADEDNLLDISADGQHVLLIGRNTTSTETTAFYNNPSEVIIWSPSTHSAEVVASDFPIDMDLRGSFAPNDSDRILLVNVDGLFLHDTNTNQTQLIRDDDDILNAYYLFSPDGTWLAILRGNEIGFMSISDSIPPSES